MLNKEGQKEKIMRRSEKLTNQIDQNGAYQLRVAYMLLAKVNQEKS